MFRRNTFQSGFCHCIDRSAWRAAHRFGEFSNIELGKVLTGKQATYQCHVDPISESIDAGSTVEDVETMLQLVYLRFTTMRQDTALFNSWKERKYTAMRNRKK